MWQNRRKSGTIHCWLGFKLNRRTKREVDTGVFREQGACEGRHGGLTDKHWGGINWRHGGMQETKKNTYNSNVETQRPKPKQIGVFSEWGKKTTTKKQKESEWKIKTVKNEYITTRENSIGSNKQWARACNKSGWWRKRKMIGRKLQMNWNMLYVSMCSSLEKCCFMGMMWLTWPSVHFKFSVDVL